MSDVEWEIEHRDRQDLALGEEYIVRYLGTSPPTEVKRTFVRRMGMMELSDFMGQIQQMKDECLEKARSIDGG